MVEPGEDTNRRISPQSGRRRFLKQLAAGLTLGAQVFPAIAEEKAERPAAAGDQVTLAETLARYAAGLKYEDLPADVVRIAKRTILDTVGCAFGGYTAGPSRIAQKLASDVSATQSPTVLFNGITPSPDLEV